MFPQPDAGSDLRTRLLQARELAQAAEPAAEPAADVPLAAATDVPLAAATDVALAAATDVALVAPVTAVARAPPVTAVALAAPEPAPAPPPPPERKNPYLVLLAPLRALAALFAGPAAAPAAAPARPPGAYAARPPGAYAVRVARTEAEYCVAAAGLPAAGPPAAEPPLSAPPAANPYIVRVVAPRAPSAPTLSEKTSVSYGLDHLLPAERGPGFRRLVRVKTVQPPADSNPYVTDARAVAGAYRTAFASKE